MDTIDSVWRYLRQAKDLFFQFLNTHKMNPGTYLLIYNNQNDFFYHFSKKDPWLYRRRQRLIPYHLTNYLQHKCKAILLRQFDKLQALPIQNLWRKVNDSLIFLNILNRIFEKYFLLEQKHWQIFLLSMKYPSYYS